MFLYVYLFIVGSCIASFANVAIYRIPKGISILKGRSYCENCHKTLCWYDLLPLVSFLLLKGKCRYCHKCISWQHFLFEGIGGILFLLCFYYYGLTVKMVIVFLIIMVLIVIAVIDYQTMNIYLSTILTLLVLVIIYQGLVKMSFVNLLLGSLCISVPMFVINSIIPSSFGFGDIELMFVSGLLLGWQDNLFATFIGFIAGGIYATYLLLSHKKDYQDYIALGPFLVFGIMIALLCKIEVVNWYLLI